ncbi:MAG: hypothetical protein ACOH5I_19300 [Oligoflexus sp.]
MERIHLVIKDSPWKFIIPLHPVQLSQQTIIAQISAIHLQSQMQLNDLQEWLEPQRHYDLQLENSDPNGPVAVVTARLDQLDRHTHQDLLSLSFTPIRGLDELEEYVNYRRQKEQDLFS